MYPTVRRTVFITVVIDFKTAREVRNMAMFVAVTCLCFHCSAGIITKFGGKENSALGNYVILMMNNSFEEPLYCLDW